MFVRRALIIGINYKYPTLLSNMTIGAVGRAGMKPLNFAEDDARAITAMLQKEGFQTESLIGMEATNKAITKALKEHSLKAGTGGLFVMYFAGHGDVDPRDPQRAYLLPIDADPDNLPATAIPLQDLNTYYWSDVGSTLILLDCCHSGYAVGGLRGHALPATVSSNQDGEFRERVKSIFGKVRGRAVLAACAESQLAKELPQLGHGVFTHYVLEHWRVSPEVDVNSLCSYVAKMMEQNGYVRPVQSINIEGSLVLRSVDLPIIHPTFLSTEEQQDLLLRLSDLELNQWHDVCSAFRQTSNTLQGKNRRAKANDLITRVEQDGQIDELLRVAHKAVGHEIDTREAKAEKERRSADRKVKVIEKDWLDLRIYEASVSTRLHGLWRQTRQQVRECLRRARTFDSATALDVRYAMADRKETEINNLISGVVKFVSQWDQDERALAVEFPWPEWHARITDTIKLSDHRDFHQIQHERDRVQQRFALLNSLLRQAQSPPLDNYVRYARQVLLSYPQHTETLEEHLVALQVALVVSEGAYKEIEMLLEGARHYKSGVSIWQYRQALQDDYKHWVGKRRAAARDRSKARADLKAWKEQAGSQRSLGN